MRATQIVSASRGMNDLQSAETPRDGEERLEFIEWISACFGVGSLWRLID